MLEAAVDEKVKLQWGPASFAGMCGEPSMVAVELRRLQWGPASFAGMCNVQPWARVPLSTGFNGARLRSPGCAAMISTPAPARIQLQWGPASFAGMCVQRRG